MDRDISVAGRNLIGKWGPLLCFDTSRCLGAGKRTLALTPQRLVGTQVLKDSDYRRCPLIINFFSGPRTTPVSSLSQRRARTTPGPHASPIFLCSYFIVVCPLASLSIHCGLYESTGPTSYDREKMSGYFVLDGILTAHCTVSTYDLAVYRRLYLSGSHNLHARFAHGDGETGWWPLLWSCLLSVLF